MASQQTAPPLKARSFTSKYLRLFHAPDVCVLQDRVVGEINEALTRSNALVVPISLSRVVRQFAINPTPLYVDQINPGCLRYEPSVKEFRIILDRRLQTDTESLLFNEEEGLRIRQRFTYAHEVAHRFFFCATPAGWKRAIEMIAEAEPSQRALGVYRILNRVEERLCNRIAGRILIPDGHLVLLCYKGDTSTSVSLAVQIVG